MGKITVVVGPPAAGKSTFVWSNRKATDVTVDADRLAQALGSEREHDAKGDIRTVMLALRRVAISMVNDGLDSDAWIIHTNPDARLVAEYIAAGATFKLIDPGEEVALERAREDGRPEGTESAIRAWYASPPDLNPKKSVPVVMLPNAERDRFEKWAQGEGFRLTVFGSTKAYRSEYTEAAWQAWRAAR